jgi:hypothetical protein
VDYWGRLLALWIPRMRRRLVYIDTSMICALRTSLRRIQRIISRCVNHAILLLLILYNIGRILLEKLVPNHIVRLPIIPLPRLVFLALTILPVLTAPPLRRPLLLLTAIAVANIMLKKHVVVVVFVKRQYLIIRRPGMTLINLQLLFLLFGTRLLTPRRIGPLMRITMSIIRLVTRETLLMLRLLNQVIDNILIKL